MEINMNIIWMGIISILLAIFLYLRFGPPRQRAMKDKAEIAKKTMKILCEKFFEKLGKEEYMTVSEFVDGLSLIHKKYIVPIDMHGCSQYDLYDVLLTILGRQYHCTGEDLSKLREMQKWGEIRDYKDDNVRRLLQKLISRQQQSPSVSYEGI